MTTEIVGASEWERNLLRYIGHHIRDESEIVDEYRAAAEESSSEAFRYLAAMIIDDEERHHHLLSDLAQSIRATAGLRGHEAPIPPLRGLTAEADRLLDLTERLLAVERADAAELRHLAHHLRDVRETTLWDLVVRLMQHDTEKHIMILEFVRERARGR